MCFLWVEKISLSHVAVCGADKAVTLKGPLKNNGIPACGEGGKYAALIFRIKIKTW